MGDIVDGWRLKRYWYWPQSHSDVIEIVLRKARQGVAVFYIPGNHDEAARQFCGLKFGPIRVEDEVIHETADGRRLLVIHGDQFDVVVTSARWLAHLGAKAYVMLLSANRWVNLVRRRLGFSYWSLSSYLKQRTKRAVEYIGNFEGALLDEARRRALDGVVCGHIHSAEFKEVDGLAYCNDGDWVESCTALVEHSDGELEILHWAKTSSNVIQLSQPDSAAA